MIGIDMRKICAGIVFVCILCVGAVRQASCGENRFDTIGGSMRCLDESPGMVRMLGENVRVTLSDGQYEVRSDITFYNEGASTTVLVGIDCSANRPKDEPVVYINGLRVRIGTDTREILDDNIQFYGTFHAMPLEFPSNRITTVTLGYSSRYGRGPGLSRCFLYKVGTGYSWYGEIVKSTYTIVFPDYEVLNLAGLKGAPFYFDYVHYYDGEDNQETAFQDNNVEFLRRNKNEIDWYVTGIAKTMGIYFAHDLGEQVYKSSLNTNRVDKSYLDKLSMRELRYLRNLFYAKHGKIFKDKDINDRLYAEYGGLTPNKDFKESDLTPEEKAAANTVLEYENKLREQSAK